jgi:hypothetical protein
MLTNVRFIFTHQILIKPRWGVAKGRSKGKAMSSNREGGKKGGRQGQWKEGRKDQIILYLSVKCKPTNLIHILKV